MNVRVAGACLLLLTWCGGLWLYRGVLAGELAGIFLVLNLLLACLPLAAATLFELMSRRWAPAHWLWFGLWLLFLPNAPYLVTDLIHLRDRPPVPLWFDAALLFSTAATGLLLGYLSTAVVQRTLERRHGRTVAWFCVLTCLLLAAFGLYLGRILRWHSWHVLTRPGQLAQELWQEVLHRPSGAEPITMTLVYGTALIMGYVILRLLAPALAATPADESLRQPP